MKVIENRFIPRGGYKAINLFGFVFHRIGSRPMLQVDLDHEAIHTAQMKEMGYVPFYIWYGIEWFFKFFWYLFNGWKAYKNISFEREAYKNQYDRGYLATRKHYAWRKEIISPS